MKERRRREEHEEDEEEEQKKVRGRRDRVGGRRGQSGQ